MERLTQELHRELLSEGYKFLLILDVVPVDGTDTYHHIVHPLKKIPAVQYFSCTTIDDGMVTAIINDPNAKINIFVDRSELKLNVF
ncbi:MAG: hypothetical protein EOP56_03470 [Sphingobacteriales bacterium]|nr:MAG: hypothetical protein EOP56_03470 [Sphingobacteriales bacterium]